MSKSSEPVRRLIKVTTIYEAVTPYPAYGAGENKELDRHVSYLSFEAAAAALAHPTSSGNDKLPQPSEPVESLEATVIDCLDSARKGDDPNALGYYLMDEIDIALQKARKDELEKIVGEAVSAIYQSDDGVGWAVPAGTIYDRLKELREESNE